MAGCEDCTHNSKPFPSYGSGRPPSDGLEHAPLRARAPHARVGARVKCALAYHTMPTCSSA
eukprot:7363010-Prymnesium_polylepis.1